MNVSSVKTLFSLFSGEEPEGTNEPLIDLAVAEVSRMLLPDADSSDVRLDFLTAAIANYRLLQVKAVRDRTQHTYAGKMLTTGAKDCEYAEKLLRDYMQLCEELIAPRIFVFSGFSSGREGLTC